MKLKFWFFLPDYFFWDSFGEFCLKVSAYRIACKWFCGYGCDSVARGSQSKLYTFIACWWVIVHLFCDAWSSDNYWWSCWCWGGVIIHFRFIFFWIDISWIWYLCLSCWLFWFIFYRGCFHFLFFGCWSYRLFVISTRCKKNSWGKNECRCKDFFRHEWLIKYIKHHKENAQKNKFTSLIFSIQFSQFCQLFLCLDSR